jgi:hypothetical protein
VITSSETEKTTFLKDISSNPVNSLSASTESNTMKSTLWQSMSGNGLLSSRYENSTSKISMIPTTNQMFKLLFETSNSSLETVTDNRMFSFGASFIGISPITTILMTTMQVSEKSIYSSIQSTQTILTTSYFQETQYTGIVATTLIIATDEETITKSSSSLYVTGQNNLMIEEPTFSDTTQNSYDAPNSTILNIDLESSVGTVSELSSTKFGVPITDKVQSTTVFTPSSHEMTGTSQHSSTIKEGDPCLCANNGPSADLVYGIQSLNSGCLCPLYEEDLAGTFYVNIKLFVIIKENKCSVDWCRTCFS